jgi:hypothetical protein
MLFTITQGNIAHFFSVDFNKNGILWNHQDVLLNIDITVDSRYLEFDGTMEKIRVNRSSTQEEL